MNNYTLILLNDGRNILVSDEKIKNSDCQYNLNGIIEKDVVPYGNSYKIIAGIELLPTLSYSDEVKEFLKTNHGWVDVEELGYRYYTENDYYKVSDSFHFINGFKAHQSITNKMFSLEEVKKAFFNGGDMKDIEEFNFFIQSLQQPIQLNVEVEMEEILSSKDIENAIEGDFVKNSRGSKGIINSLSDDVRVGIGDFIEISQTGNDGRDTLNINGYKIYNLQPKVTNNSILITKILN